MCRGPMWSGPMGGVRRGGVRWGWVRWGWVAVLDSAAGAAGTGSSGPGPSGSSSGSCGPSGSWGAASLRASSRACSSRPGASKGSRRRRCGRASRAAMRISSSVTTSRPPQAARAIAVRAVTRSARMPSTPNAPQTAQIWRSAASGSSTRGSRARAAATCPASAAVSASKRRTNAAGSASNASLRRTTSARSAGSWLAVDLDGQPEPVQKLRAQLALFRVHGADQQETRGMPDRDALALHVVHAQGGGVEEQVDQVVMEQVDLVDVEHAAVRRGEQAGLEGGRARGQHALDVERAGQPVLGGPDRQFGQRDRAELRRHGAVRARWAGGVGRGGIAGIRTAGDHGYRRQQRGQPADHGRLRGALLAADQDTPDGRRHRVKQQSQLQVGHPDDAGERIGTVLVPGRGRHRASPSRVSSPEVRNSRQPESLAPGLRQ